RGPVARADYRVGPRLPPGSLLLRGLSLLLSKGRHSGLNGLGNQRGDDIALSAFILSYRVIDPSSRFWRYPGLDFLTGATVSWSVLAMRATTLPVMRVIVGHNKPPLNRRWFAAALPRANRRTSTSLPDAPVGLRPA